MKEWNFRVIHKGVIMGYHWSERRARAHFDQIAKHFPGRMAVQKWNQNQNAWEMAR